MKNINLKQKLNKTLFTLEKVLMVFLTISITTTSNAQFLSSNVFAEEAASDSAKMLETLSIISESEKASLLDTIDKSGEVVSKLKEETTVQTLSKKSYQYKEKIVFNLYFPTKKGVKIVVKNKAGKTIPAQITENRVDDDITRVALSAPQNLEPGKYELEIIEDGKVISSQEFLWGVLAINSDKSIYLFNETAKFSIAVLDETGEMVCDAKLSLIISDPLGNPQTLTTESEIRVNDQCSSKELSLIPDYEAEFELGSIPGNYKVILEAETKNGKYKVEDGFEVREAVDFDVKRNTATRLYPHHFYPVEINIEVNADFKGRITEVVPESFEINQSSFSQVSSYSKIETVSQSEVTAEKVLGSRALRLPFESEKEVTLGFGQDLLDPQLSGKYKEHGVIAHDGVDFAVEIGTQIFPIDSGEIVITDENGDYGATMVVQHEWGRSYYGHLSEFNKSVGDKVYKDDVIALSGDTGLSTGAHLHLGVKLNKNDKYNGFYGKINPAILLGIENDGKVLGESSDPRVKVKVITWEVDAKRGDTLKLGYEFKSPPESPQFYRLGPVRMFDEDDSLVFQEGRQWQLAVDAAIDPVVGFFSPPAIWTNAGDTNLALTQPDPRTNDLMLAVIAMRPAATTIDTPSGWTLLDYRSGTDGGAEAADTGSVGIYWFYKVADGTEGTSTQTFTKSGTASVWMGQILQARSATGTYDLAAAGYSLNGDVTAWNGTLDSDIGLRGGDLVLLSAAQNGDLGGSSAQNIAATNINVKTTGNEHGEFTSTTGNDVEVDLATSYIFEGVNLTTPTVTTTVSPAASGAITAVRVRQGSGTNRTDTWVRAAGKQIAGSTSVAVTYPEHEIGDLLVLFVGSRGSTDPTINVPTGWTDLGTYSGGAGSWAADSGNARVRAMYRQVTSRFLSGSQAVTVTSGLVSIGQMYAIHKDDVSSWNIDSDGGSDNSGGTSWSVTGSGIDLSSSNGGDILLALSSINTDARTFSGHGMSASGMTFGEVTQTGFFTSATSNDMAIEAATGRVTGGSDSSPAPTFTSTASGSTANSPAGSTIFIKINGNDQTYSSPTVGFFSPERLWTASTTTTLNLRQPDPRNGDLLIATIAVRPSSITMNTPSGWTLLDSRTGTDGGAEGADTGSVALYTFYKVADGTEGTANQAFTVTSSPSVWIGSITQTRSATGTYSLSAGGYSKNGDTTAWSGSLDADIGLTQGDIVLVVAAQNGDLGATSNWDVTATGITQSSTANEHGEFPSTSGNDIEIDMATKQIWEGTNTNTPDVALTQSAAVSGTVAAIRIRQGSGTNRTDTWVRSAGVQVVGTSTLATPYPDHEVGDMFILFIANRDASDTIPNQVDGWTSLGTYIGGVGTFGADSGNARISAYYREATSRRFGTQTVTVSPSNTAATQIISVHRDDVTSWTIDSDGGSDSTSGTAWSVTGSGIDLASASGGDIVLVGSSMNTDLYTYTNQALSASGITFGDVTETSEYRSATGNDMTLEVVTGRVSGGTSNGVVPTYTTTSSGSTANAPTGASLFIKILGNIAGGPETPTLSQLMRHGRWFNTSGALQPFTF